MTLPLVTVEGRAVNDPELRFAPSGVAVGRLRMVASSRKRTEAGEWVDDKTLWLDVTFFKQLAENVAESIGKGDLITVVGKLQTDEWTNEAGEKRSKIVLIADSVSASLQFRTIKHGEGKVQRSSSQAPNQPAREEAWSAPPQDDQPPF